MAPPVPTIEPVQATAGSTWTWKTASATYPVAEFTLSYSLNGVSKLIWSAGWLASDGQTVTIPATTTAILHAGRYEITRVWTGIGAYTGARYSEALPALTILPNPATQAPGSRVAFAETALAYVETALLGRFAVDMPEEYSIGGRSVRKMTLVELQQARVSLQAELRRLTGRSSVRMVRFTVPTA